MTDRVAHVQDRLGAKLPADYADFIRHTGLLIDGPMEVYGYSEEVVNEDAIPCVIGATKLYREDYGLAPQELVVAHTGDEDYLAVLDTVSGEVVERNAAGDVLSRAGSFREWLARAVGEEIALQSIPHHA